MAKTFKPYLSLLIIAILAVVLYAGTLSALILNVQVPLPPNSNTQGKTSTVNIFLYVGEYDGRPYFSNSSMMSMATSPGPSLEFSVSDTVSITVINVGSQPHAFAITDEPQTGATVLFSAEIGSTNNPILPHQEGSVIFSPDMTGQFFYISPLPGQAEAGMYGMVSINGGSMAGGGSSGSGMSGLGM